MEMEKIEFTLFELKLQEPMALITNWMIAIVCIIYFLKTDESNALRKLWRKFFIFMAISTIIGGMGHLFFKYTGMPGKMFAWWFSVISVYYAERTVIVLSKKEFWKNFLRIILPLKAIIFIVLSAITQNFMWILISSAIAFVIVLLPNYIEVLREKKEGAGYFVTGILILLVPAFVQVFKFSPYLWLNKDDIAHLFMIAAITFFFIGAKRIARLS